LFDSFVGVRAGGRNVWLNEMPPAEVGYAAASGVIRVVHRLGDLRIETFVYAPWELARPAVVLLARATNLGDATQRVSLYTLHNYHLGFTTMADRVRPDAEGERLVYRAERGAYVESGIGGTLVHQALGPTSHHGATPDNPWQALRAGADLADTADSGVGSDRVAGFQQDLELAAGQAGWIGVVSAFASGQDAAPALAELQTAFGARGPRAVLELALAEWESWRKPPPAGLSAGALAVWRQSEAVLRMGQVWETTDRSKGQIVASLPPGMWNITWARDMAYAMVALARSGHHAEAKAALAFVLGAESGRYAPMYVPVPYQVSITRYFGRGKEETDFDANGPNIEYDGFGLTLWALSEYVAASGDMAFLAQHWPTVQTRIADALVGLVDPALGLIAADSSIWEVHWNGRQKHYTYTSIAAARGLCGAGALARLRGDAALATRYESAAMGLRDALLTHSVDPGGVLASSVEELRSGSGYHDMASTEAIGWSLISPTGRVARATLAGLGGALAVASGRGFFRNDDGGWYDLQEWVFVDLRASVSHRRAGNAAEAERLLDWITAQALANAGLVAELQEPSTSAYEGAVPMVGFGAGGYLLAALERAHPQMAAPACGAWEVSP
jgi:GH15 family glucan-1,4-alpha-glucosidase